MGSTSHPEFNENTEGLDVVKAFSDRVRGKTVVVTGVNRSGIGFSTAEAFASGSPSHVIVAGRSLPRLQQSIDDLRKRFPEVDYRPLQIDLSSQNSVRKAASELLAWPDVLSVDFLVNSAGIMLIPERTLSEDGIELHFATNHIGHFLFACSIMPKLIKAAQTSPKGATRIINVTSASPMVSSMRWSDLNFEKKNKDLPEAEQPNYDMLQRWGATDVGNQTYVPLEGYNQSKVANVLFSIAATKRLFDKHGIISLAVHPGVIQTELARNAAPETAKSIQEMHKSGIFSYRTLGAGSATSLVAALDPKLGPGENKGGSENHGIYLADCQVCDKAHPLAVSSSEAERLWKLSEELVHEKFAW